MNERIFNKVKAYIERYKMLAPGDTVVLGVSGGADSVCLLLMLHELAREMPLNLLVVHVNHGIRAEGVQDAAYVNKLCTERNLPFFLVEKNVKEYARREKLSEEEAGRKVRYEAFERILKEYCQSGKENQYTGEEAVCGRTADDRIAGGRIAGGRIAVAHNAGDRVETMLFHLFRGTGLAGASGIKPVRGNIIRPLLCLSREEIEEYLYKKEISFCIDRTNLEDTYTRNRIRNHIIPFAEREICRGASAHMWETADMILETEEYVRKQAEKALMECRIKRDEKNSAEKSIVLSTGMLAAKEPLILKSVLLLSLEELADGRKDITSSHIEALQGLLTKSGSKRISLPNGMTAVKEYGHLVINVSNEAEDSCADTIINQAIAIQVPGNVYIEGLGEVEFSLLPYEKSQIIPEKSYTKWFDYDRITRSLIFRTRETGDFLTINEQLSRKTLKNYMIEEKIPKNQREKIYVLAEDSHILWVPGYRISQYYKITENTKNILQVQVRGGL